MMPNHYEASHDSKGAPISSGAETAGQLEEISNMDDPKLENAEEAENLNERDARAIAYLLHEMNPAEASAYERQLEADAPSRAQIAEGRQALGLIRGTMLSPPGIQRVEKLAIPRIGSPITQRRRTGYWLGVAGLLAAAMLAIVLLRPEAPQISNRMKIESVASGPAHDALKIKPGGAGHWTVSANSRIAATADSTALFTWGKSLRGVLAQNAEVEGENDRALKLTSGAAWFWVEKGGKGVTVDTRFGKVSVWGTSFGVSVAESGALVEVVEGEVAVEAASEEEAVQPGRQLAFTAQGLGTDSARQEGRQLPHWVREAVNQNGSAWAEGVLPSLAGEKHADINR